MNEWQRKRGEALGVFNAPNEWLWLNHPRHKDWARKSVLHQVGRAAAKEGIDPYSLGGVLWAETHFGNLHPSNPPRIDLGTHEKSLTKQGIKEGDPEGLINFAAQLLKEHFAKHPDDPIAALQAYSGYGHTVYGGSPKEVKELYGTTKLFGKPFQKIDFWKEKPQGKAAYELGEDLRDNEDVRAILENPRARFNIDNFLAQERANYEYPRRTLADIIPEGEDIQDPLLRQLLIQ